MSQVNKKYLAKLYERDGSTLAINIPHKAIRNPPQFTDRINGGMGECVVDYVMPFDSFGEGVDVDHQFMLEVWAFDDDNPLGRLIYSGAVQEFEPYIKGAQQGVYIKALGYGSNLSYDAYMASSRTVYTVTHTTVDPSAIFEAIIDEYNAQTENVGSELTYDTDSVGVNVSKEFVDKTWFDACEETRELCPDGWWWHVDAQRVASLKPKPATPTHRFIIGKHIQEGNFPKSVKTVKNRVRVTRNGGTVTHYSDATSISNYESRLEMINDSGLTDVNAADQRGNKVVDDNKDPKTRSRLIINTEYDLESIKVGQTCRILNTDAASTFFGDNILIVGLTYNGNTVELELEESASDLGLALQKFVNS